MKTKLGEWLTVLGAGVLLIGLPALWIANVVKLFGLHTVASGEGVLRILGIIIPPLGSLLGIF